MDQRFEVCRGNYPHLQIRVVDEFADHPKSRKILVVDENGWVLGDLSKSITEVRMKMTGSELAILSIDFAIQHLKIESLSKDLK